MKQSETPRTDELIAELNERNPYRTVNGPELQLVEHARELEVENNELRAQAEQQGWSMVALRKEIDELRKEKERVVTSHRTYGHGRLLHEQADVLIDTALRQALPLPPLATQPDVQEAVELAKWVVTKPHLDLTGEAGTILARALLKVVGQ